MSACLVDSVWGRSARLSLPLLALFFLSASNTFFMLFVATKHIMSQQCHWSKNQDKENDVTKITVDKGFQMYYSKSI